MRRITARQGRNRTAGRGETLTYSAAPKAQRRRETAEPGEPEQNNVARIKDGAGNAGGNADVYTRTEGRGETAAEPTAGPDTAPCNVMRAGKLKSSRGAPNFYSPARGGACVRR